MLLGRTSNSLAVATFLFLKSQSRVTYHWKAMDKCYLSCFIHFYGRTMFRGIELLPKILTSKTAKYISSDFPQFFSEGAYSHPIHLYQVVCRVLYWCIDFCVFSRVRVYTKKLAKVTTFFICVYLSVHSYIFTAISSNVDPIPPKYMITLALGTIDLQ